MAQVCSFLRQACLFFVLLLAPLVASAISGGIQIKDVQNSQFGFLRIVQVEDGVCSGALIADNMVLTAAHCLFNKNGRPQKAWILRYLNDPKPKQAKLAYVHKDFNYEPSVPLRPGLKGYQLHNDLAVLVFDSYPNK